MHIGGRISIPGETSIPSKKIENEWTGMDAEDVDVNSLLLLFIVAI